jgi:hypothetical protein
MAIELVFKDKDGNEKRVKRNEANLRDMERFLTFRKWVQKGLKDKTYDEIEAMKKQVEFLVEFYKEQGVTEEALLDGINSATFDEQFENICRQISPSHFERSDRLKKGNDSGGNKEKSK